jgi:hypothetical protein
MCVDPKVGMACNHTCRPGDCRYRRRSRMQAIAEVDYEEYLEVAGLARSALRSDAFQGDELRARLTEALSHAGHQRTMKQPEQSLRQEELELLRAIHTAARLAVDGDISIAELKRRWRDQVTQLDHGHRLPRAA